MPSIFFLNPPKEFLFSHLCQPFSFRIHQGSLFLCLSAVGFNFLVPWWFFGGSLPNSNTFPHSVSSLAVSFSVKESADRFLLKSQKKVFPPAFSTQLFLYPISFVTFPLLFSPIFHLIHSSLWTSSTAHTRTSLFPYLFPQPKSLVMLFFLSTFSLPTHTDKFLQTVFR